MLHANCLYGNEAAVGFDNSTSANSSVNALNVGYGGTPLLMPAPDHLKRRSISDGTPSNSAIENSNSRLSIPPTRVRLLLTHQQLTDADVAQKLKRCISYIRKRQNLCSLPTLALEINLNHNAVGCKGLHKLLEVIEEAAQVGTPRLPINYFECISNAVGDDGARALAHLLGIPTLHRLKVGDNRLTAVGARIIAEALRQVHPKFIQLHIGGNPIGDEGVRDICDACVTNKVEVLGLRDISFSVKGWEAVGRLVSANTACVKEIQLKGNPLTIENVEALARGCQSVTSPEIKLVTLGINNCAIHPESAEKLFGILSNANAIAALDVSNNPLGDAGVHIVLDWLAARKPNVMAKLSLDETGIGSASLRILASRPQMLSTITHLTLSNNKFTQAEDIPALVTIIRSAPLLESIDLSHCHLFGRLDSLVEALISRPNLRSVYFASNFGANAPWPLLIAKCPRLQRLTLTNNGLSNAAIQPIIDSMADSHSMTFIQLGGQSKVPPMANELLREAVARANNILDRNCRSLKTTNDTIDEPIIIQGDAIDASNSVSTDKRYTHDAHRPPPSYDASCAQRVHHQHAPPYGYPQHAVPSGPQQPAPMLNISGIPTQAVAQYYQPLQLVRFAQPYPYLDGAPQLSNSFVGPTPITTPNTYHQAPPAQYLPQQFIAHPQQLSLPSHNGQMVASYSHSPSMIGSSQPQLYAPPAQIFSSFANLPLPTPDTPFHWAQ